MHRLIFSVVVQVFLPPLPPPLEENGDTSPEENGDTSHEENGDTSHEENGDTSQATVKRKVEGNEKTGWYFCEERPSMKSSS